MLALRCENLTLGYTNRPPVLTNFQLNIAPGEIVGIAGESGSGKTTLLRAIAGLLPVSSGTLETSAPIAYVPQESLVSLSPFLTIASHFEGLAGAGDLEAVGLPRRTRNAYPHELSGGERQRVLFALALACQPTLLLADEPTAHLDSTNTQRLINLLQAQAAMGAAILLATHQEQLFACLKCRVLRLTPAPPSQPAQFTANTAAQTLVEVTGLRKTYYHRDAWLRRKPTVEALKGVTLQLLRGQTAILRGPSGIGKSTLARCLAGWETYDAGTIAWPSGKPRVQIVPQSPSDSVNPNFGVIDTLREAGVEPHGEMLAQVGLPAGVLSRNVTALSEGQRARLAIFRAAEYCRDGLLILDESLAGLDASTRNQVLAYLQTRKGLTLLILTHDDQLAATLQAPQITL